MAKKKAKTKRKATPAQLRNLAKGRAALKKKRAKKKAPRRKKNQIRGNYLTARSALKRGVNPHKRSGPGYKGYVVASFKPGTQTVEFWNGKGWGTHNSAASYMNTEYATYVARKCKRFCGVASVNMAGADIRLKMLGHD